MPRSTQPLAVTVELSGNVRPLKRRQRRCRRHRRRRRRCRRRRRRRRRRCRLFAPPIFHDLGFTASGTRVFDNFIARFPQKFETVVGRVGTRSYKQIPA